MKEIDKINLFIQYLITTSRFESQEEVGKFIGYGNKSSFSQMLKREMTPKFRESFMQAFPEFENFFIGFTDNSEVNVPKGGVGLTNKGNAEDKDLSDQINVLQNAIEDLKSKEEEHTKAILKSMRKEFTAVFDYFQKENVQKEKENTK